MVALELECWSSPHYLPKSGRMRPVHDMEDIGQAVAVTDAEGSIIAYVPTEMGQEAAAAHAVMFAEAARLLELIRFAATHVGADAHPGLLRQYQAYCQEVIDRVDDAIVSG